MPICYKAAAIGQSLIDGQEVRKVIISSQIYIVGYPMGLLHKGVQYKILDNILYLNERQYKFYAVDSLLFSLCRAYNESIKHLFILYMHSNSETATSSLIINARSSFFSKFRAKNSNFWLMEREKFELYSYESYYLNIETSREKKENKLT